ncbi:hypothetical protein A1C_02590 [Rickettsia akari str. Hartford]|uniref:Uncharacterized protein n=1 Tax=Rickettsia akari (strain Hartford) TaxID=293614 RepID=A8GN40_RICAH|nr:hypothetical protein A1C_02590 [Rickettsia akari str. Hartford]
MGPKTVKSADIFFNKWQEVEDNKKYKKMKIEWKKQYW